MNAPAAPVLLTAEQVAPLVGFGVEQVYVMARAGKLPARKVGRSVRFLPAEIDAWAAALPRTGT